MYIEKAWVLLFYKCNFKHTIEDIYIQNSTIGIAHNDVVPPHNCPFDWKLYMYNSWANNVLHM
jgi:hypothetical protein